MSGFVRTAGSIVIAASIIFGSVLSSCGGAPSRPATMLLAVPRSRSADTKPIQPPSILRESEAAWRAVRQRYPLHFQAVFEARRADGGTTVIVTEPPPHARLDDIQHILGATAVGVRETRIGYDGVLRDVLAALPPSAAGDDSNRDRLAELHRYLFHSTYRAQVYDAFAEVDHKPLNLDLAIPLGSLHTWVLAPKRRFRSLDGSEVTGRDLAHATQTGVFRAEDVGVSVWSIPTGTDLCDVLADARNFTVETDLLLGGLRVESGLIIVGRSRTTRLEDLPPLRTEMLLALTAADPRELAQSYERTNFFAGKLADGSDWAPILLSAELVDTEFGGLLNVTDQLLKGWSMNGFVQYANFPYPKPEHWAAPQRLDEELGAESITFNWNTSGAMAGLEWKGVAALVNPRTGALPIAYIPEGEQNVQTNIVGIEERNQDFFAGRSDPNLTRVVGYTTFYHLAKEFVLHAGQSCLVPLTDAARTKRTDGETYLEETLQNIIDGRAAPGLVAHLDEDGKKLAAVIREAAKAVEDKLGRSRRDEFVHYLAGVSSFQTVADPNESVAEYASKFREQVAGWTAEGYLDKLFDRDTVFKAYLRRAKRSATGYISTPTVVVSSVPPEIKEILVDGKLVRAVFQGSGGHNLRLAPGIVRVEPELTVARVSSTHPFEFDAAVSERHLWVDPRVFQHIQKAVQDGRIDAEVARLELDAAAKTPVRLPDLPPPTLDVSGVGFDVPRGPRGPVPEAERVFGVRFADDKDRMYLATAPDGHAIAGGSTHGMLDALVADIRRYKWPVNNEPLFLDLQGFSELRAKNFSAEVAMRLDDTSARRVAFVMDRPGLLGKVRQWLRRFSPNPSVEITELASSDATGSATLASYRVRIPKAPGNLLVRVHARINAVVRSAFAEKIRAIFQTKQQRSLVEQLETFCNHENVSLDVSIEDLGAPPDTQVNLERRRGDAARAQVVPPATDRLSYAGKTSAVSGG